MSRHHRRRILDGAEEHEQVAVPEHLLHLPHRERRRDRGLVEIAAGLLHAEFIAGLRVVVARQATSSTT
jgi:hypothetical protein